MRTISFGYETVRLLVLAMTHYGRTVARPLVFRTLLGLPSKAYEKNIRQEIITRVLEDIGDEGLIQMLEPIEGQQRMFGLTEAGRSELVGELHERQAVFEALQSIKELIGSQAA